MHCVRVLASRESCPLELNELLVLYLYTGYTVVFSQILDWLSSNASSQELVSHRSLSPFLHYLYSSIRALPPYTPHEVYRAVDLPFEPLIWRVGSTVTWQNFSICSKQWRECAELIQRCRGMVFVVQCRTGRDISAFSKYRVHEEVYFLAREQVQGLGVL